MDQDIDNFLTEYYAMFEAHVGPPAPSAGRDRMQAMDMIQAHPTFSMPKYKTLLEMFFKDKDDLNVRMKWPLGFFIRSVDSLEFKRKKHI